MLIPMSICVMALTAEGFVKYRVNKLAPPVLQAKIREAIEAGNYQDAWQLCQDNRCFLSTVLSAGLERIGRSKEAVDFAVQRRR
jgi:biopolymer transport protein ExbB